MGNSSQTDNRRKVRGGILIKLHKTVFVSNEVIEGMLCISLEENFRGSLLQVSIVGQDETFFVQIIDSSKDKHHKRRRIQHRNIHTFVDFPVPIFDFSMGNKTLSLLFLQIQVAQILPSTMSYFKNETTYCKVKYQIRASILSNLGDVQPVQGAQDISIGQVFNIPRQPYQLSEESNPKVCCCCGSGKIQLMATIDSKQYSPLDNILVQLNCDLSNYDKDIQSLQVSLIGSLTMKGENTNYVHKAVLFDYPVNVPIVGKKVTGTIKIPIPSTIQLSVTSDLVKLSYSVQILPTIDSCCVADNSCLLLPIAINTSIQSMQYIPSPQLLQIPPPQNWNPQQLQQAQFNPQQAQIIQQQQAQYTQSENTLQNQQLSYLGQQPPMMLADNSVMLQVDNSVHQQFL